MKNHSNHLALALSMAALLTTGCASNMSTTSTAPVALIGPHLTGSVHGGRQPISGATLHLYAASTAGYAATNTDLLTSTVQTDPTGMFSITGKYTCTSGQQLYLVALGGNPGAGSNPQAGIMAALGDCANLSAVSFINMNEITTVGSVFALAPFMQSTGVPSSAALGTSSTNTLGLQQAFVSVNKLVNIATGLSGGPALAAGAAVPAAEINTIADILASCVNSAGGTYNDGSICGTEFSYVAASSATSPTDTIGLALAIAKNPAQNVSSLINYATPVSPYSPQLTGTPNDFTLAITYTAGRFNAPKSTTIDANGNVWVANSGNNTVTLLAQTGTPATGSPFAGNGLTGPAAVAIDASGNGWVANKGNTIVSAFTSTGGALTGSPFTVGAAPTALAFDAAGNVFVANSGSSNVSELSSTGAPVQTISTGVAAPSAIAINPR